MNTKGNKGSVILIAFIMVVVVSTLFLIVEVTPLFIAAYVFALIGIVGFCIGNIYLFAHKKSYPWFAAFPMTIWQYLIAEVILSAIFIIRENIFNSSISVKIFVAFHVVLMAFFTLFLILLKGGKEMIEERDVQVKEKVGAIRLMQADIESLIYQFPDYAKNLREVADAIRYSDPMSNSALAALDEQIQQGITALAEFDGKDNTRIPKMCAILLRQIADRNARVKLMK